MGWRWPLVSSFAPIVSLDLQHDFVANSSVNQIDDVFCGHGVCSVGCNGSIAHGAIGLVLQFALPASRDSLIRGPAKVISFISNINELCSDFYISS